jgi:hypothetical protein
LEKSSNKNLIQIIKKVVGENKRAWDGYLKFAPWENHFTKKHATNKSSFKLVYDVVLPVNLRLLVYKLLEEFTINHEALKAHIDLLEQLDEDQRIAYTHFIDYQGQVKKVFDRKAKGKSLQVGYLVLLWDKRNEKARDRGNFDSLWLGAYLIDAVVGPNTFNIEHRERERAISNQWEMLEIVLSIKVYD